MKNSGCDRNESLCEHHFRDFSIQSVIAVYNDDDTIKEPQPPAWHRLLYLVRPQKWKYQSHSGGYWECADLFEFLLENGQKKWLLTDASNDYRIGPFDGKKFVLETPLLADMSAVKSPASWTGFYAAQTFSNEPKGRRIQIGWFQTGTNSKPFNQSMSLPNELKLKTTPADPRLTWTPIPELESLRAQAHHLCPQTLVEIAPNPLETIKGERLELRAELDPGTANEIKFNLCGIEVTYSATPDEISVGGHHAPAPLQHGKLDFTIYLDRNNIDLYACDGLVFIPVPLYPDTNNLSFRNRNRRSRQILKTRCRQPELFREIKLLPHAHPFQKMVMSAFCSMNQARQHPPSSVQICVHLRLKTIHHNSNLTALNPTASSC